MPTNAGVRARRLRALVTEEQRLIEEFRTRVARRREAVETLVRDLNRDESRLEDRLARFEARLKQLDEWKTEPVVVVRSSAGGYAAPVYHDAKEPCGFGRNLIAPRSMLLAEAEDGGHHPCMSCGWRAKRRRIKAAA
jgi:hypothetical protein